MSDYAGTVIVVSHDRDFLDRVATSVIIAEGEGGWTEYAGGYSDMVIQRGEGVTRPRASAKARAARPACPAAHGPDPRQAQAELQGKARARNAAQDHREARSRDHGAQQAPERFELLCPGPRGLRQGHARTGRKRARPRRGRDAVARARRTGRTVRRLARAGQPPRRPSEGWDPVSSAVRLELLTSPCGESRTWQSSQLPCSALQRTPPAQGFCGRRAYFVRLPPFRDPQNASTLCHRSMAERAPELIELEEQHYELLAHSLILGAKQAIHTRAVRVSGCWRPKRM